MIAPDVLASRVRASRLLVRLAILLLLALLALMLAADSAEYRALSRAGVRVFTRGVLPLGLVAALNFHALDAGRGWRLAALGANVAVLAAGVRLLQPGAPPFVAILCTVGTVLVLAMAALMVIDARSRETTQ